MSTHEHVDTAAVASETWIELRLRRLSHVLTREWLLWTIAGAFWARVAFFAALNYERPDGAAILADARAFIYEPSQLYAYQAEYLAKHGAMAPHGWSGPPAGLLLAAPFGLLPPEAGLRLWVAADGAAILAALGLLYLCCRPTRWRRPLFVLLAGYFPPLFADLDAGQLGGFLLLLSALAIWLHSRGRSSWGGAAAGLAAAVKLYPAALLIGIKPRRLLLFAGPMAIAAAAVNLVGFLRIGRGSAAFYLTDVLLPSLRAPVSGDCAVDSPHTLVYRTIGGDAYAYIARGGGLARVQLPLHLPEVAAVLTYLLLALTVVAAFYAAWRSGWNPVYGPSVGLALGAILPSEVNVYQKLALLPLLLIVAMRAGELRRYAVLGALAVPVLLLVEQPCYLPFPDLWTLSVLAIFGIGVLSWRLFTPTPPAGPRAPGGAWWRRRRVRTPGR